MQSMIFPWPHLQVQQINYLNQVLKKWANWQWGVIETKVYSLVRDEENAHYKITEEAK